MSWIFVSYFLRIKRVRNKLTMPFSLRRQVYKNLVKKSHNVPCYIDIYRLVKSGTKKVESFCKYEANIDDVREQEASLDYTPVE